jgi:hypothetical protein
MKLLNDIPDLVTKAGTSYVSMSREWFHVTMSPKNSADIEDAIALRDWLNLVIGSSQIKDCDARR